MTGTADNLADNADAGIDPTILANLLRGNWSGAAHNLVSPSAANLSGNTEATRREMARLLLQTGSQADGFRTAMLTEQQRQADRQLLARLLLQSARAGAVTEGSRR